MSTETLTPIGNGRLAGRRISQSDYQRLGLRRREARVDVIRQAVTRAASDVRDSMDPGDGEHAWEAGQERLAAVVTSGYRLLDPRRRISLIERIHLLIPADEEGAASSASSVMHLADHRPEKRSSKRKEHRVDPVIPRRGSSMDAISADDRRERLDSFEVLAAQDVVDLLRKRDRCATLRLFLFCSLAVASISAVAMVALS